MQIAELIALAAVRSGKKRQELGAEMGHNDKHRISKLATERLKADASEIVFLAMAAKMNPIEVLAEVETERHPELSQVWQRVRENMRSLYFAQVAARVDKRRRKVGCNRAPSDPPRYAKVGTNGRKCPTATAIQKG